MNDLWQDLRYALRALTARPSYSLLAILTLTVGLGTSTAMFSLVQGILLQPLPYPEPERIVSLYRTFAHLPGRETRSMSRPDAEDFSQQISAFEAVAGTTDSQLTVKRDGAAYLVDGGLVVGELLRVFGLAPVLGRDFQWADSELGTPYVTVVSQRYWQQELGGGPDVLGTVIDVNGDAHTVIGVAPDGFSYPDGAAMWVPWKLDPEDCDRGCHLLKTVARLQPGIDLEAANLELEALATRLEAAYPDSNTHKRFSGRSLLEQMVGSVGPALWMLLAAVQLVVLIAAANVTNLILVRGTGRRRELAVRTALGASRWRLFQQMLVENGLLALTGAVGGLLLARAALAILPRVARESLPRLQEVGIDGPVMWFAFALAWIGLMLSGLLPAWRLSMISLRSRGSTQGVSGRRSKSLLLVAEVALSLMLVLGSGLLLRSFLERLEVDLGFDRRNVIRFGIYLPESVYSEPEDASGFFRRLEEEIRALPEVEAVGAMFAPPFGANNVTSVVRPMDRPDAPVGEELFASFDVVTPGAFETLEIPLLEGRLLNEGDRHGQPLVLVVNQRFVDEIYGGKSPIGERMKIEIGFGYDNGGEEHTIVGVVGNALRRVETGPESMVYLTQAQMASPYLSMLVATRGAGDVVPAIRQRVQSLDPLLPMRSIETLDEAVDRSLGAPRFYLILLGGFAGIALLLAAVGLYGVASYLVSQRVRELAIRQALGARKGQLLRLVMEDSLRPVVAGLMVGLAGAWAARRMVESLLFGISPGDGVTFLTAPLLLLGVAVLAVLWPARRALGIEPRAALGAE